LANFEGTKTAPTLAAARPEFRLAWQLRSEAKAGPVVAPGTRIVIARSFVIPLGNFSTTFGQLLPVGMTALAWRCDFAIEFGTTSVYAATIPVLGAPAAIADGPLMANQAETATINPRDFDNSLLILGVDFSMLRRSARR
jgi:hypothetical protein